MTPGGSAALRAGTVGRLHIHAATPRHRSAGSQGLRGGIAHVAQAEPTAIIRVASCSARSGIEGLARQLLTIGPKRGWLSTQAS